LPGQTSEEEEEENAQNGANNIQDKQLDQKRSMKAWYAQFAERQVKIGNNGEGEIVPKTSD